MPTVIETIDEWNELKSTLQEFDYHHWQSQFGTDQPEGFIVTFADTNGRELSITTHSRAVHRAILRFCSES